MGIMEYNIDTDSKKLREMVGSYDCDGFMGQVAVLLSMIRPPIPYKPFHVLDAPMKMLTYMAGLNLSADQDIRKPYHFDEHEWKQIIMQMVKVKAGYFDLFMPPTDADKIEYYEFYKVSMPVFMEYFDNGPTNFEEQVIERIERIFSPIEKELTEKFGLGVKDFVAIYNEIDNQLFLNLNRYTALLKNPICKEFWDRMYKAKTSPAEWKYDGDEKDLIELVQIMKYQEERFKVSKDTLCAFFDRTKIDCFLSILMCKQEPDAAYLYYADINKVMRKPIYQLGDGRILIVHDKQILDAIFNHLYDFCRTIKNGDRLFRRRGNYLQEKIVEVLKHFFGQSAFIYDEYKTAPKGHDRQDILVLAKGLALVIEAKAGDRVEPGRETKQAFEQIYYNFKRNIQKGYEQAYRLKKKFDTKEDFDIYDRNDVFQYRVKTKHYHNIFSIIVTLEKFGPVQTDLTKILEMDTDDDQYPLSICIDDLETLLLTMKKKKKGIGDLIRFLTMREALQGRLRISDELSIWGEFILNPNFKPKDDLNVHFMPGERADDLYDDEYASGLGFVNEKNIDRKKDERWVNFSPAKISEFLFKKNLNNR